MDDPDLLGDIDNGIVKQGIFSLVNENYSKMVTHISLPDSLSLKLEVSDYFSRKMKSLISSLKEFFVPTYACQNLEMINFQKLIYLIASHSADEASTEFTIISKAKNGYFKPMKIEYTLLDFASIISHNVSYIPLSQKLLKHIEAHCKLASGGKYVHANLSLEYEEEPLSHIKITAGETQVVINIYCSIEDKNLSNGGISWNVCPSLKIYIPNEGDRLYLSLAATHCFLAQNVHELLNDFPPNMTQIFDENDFIRARHWCLMGTILGQFAKFK